MGVIGELGRLSRRLTMSVPSFRWQMFLNHLPVCHTVLSMSWETMVSKVAAVPAMVDVTVYGEG